MKKIILFRHAMATNFSEETLDHDRILAQRGIADAQKMGRYLKNKKDLPEYVISSSAIRAKTTAELATKSGEWNCKITIEKNIYGGNPNYLMSLLNSQSDDIDFICLVGHEPNFSHFISLATGVNKNFPTGSMAKISFNFNHWNELYFNLGKLDWLVYPEDI